MARQPIMDREEKVYAYELLYRKDSESAPLSMDEADEHRALLNSMVEVGLTRLVGDKPAFFNLSPRMLGSVCTSLLPPERVVLEMLEDTVLDEATSRRIDELKAQGYCLAYDDFTFQPHQLPFASRVDLIKVDVMDTPWPVVQRGVPVLRKAGVRLLAEKVEDREMYERCRKLGFELFQGYYFARPETLAAKGVETRQRAVLRLLNALNRPDATAAQLEAAIAQDATLAARLLKLVNSAGFGASRRVESIRVAIQMLGLARLQAFATVLVASGANGADHRALSDLGLVRARLCERLATQLGHGDAHKHFTVGLLSVLDALLGIPMDQIVAELSLTDDVSAALLDPDRSEELRMVTAFERDGWSALRDYPLDRNALSQTYADAVADAAALA